MIWPMNRTPIILSLAGLALCVLGLFLMLRVVMPTPLTVSMGDQYGFEEKSKLNMVALTHEAVPGVFGTYVVLTATGFAIFVSGLAMMLARARGD